MSIIKRFFNRKQVATVKAAEPVRRKPVGFGTFSRLKPVGRYQQRPRAICSTWIFKEAFYREFGVRLK